jgi:indole-3-glycerol phosphate synthase
MNILDKIIISKRNEVNLRKRLFSVDFLEKSSFFERKTYSLADNLIKKSPGIIAEFKRKSPSANSLNELADVKEVINGYVDSGAAALSILTDHKFFGGNLSDLAAARNQSNYPVLRKDFIIDEYQVIEAKASGADAVLLIAEILTENQIRNFSRLARSLSMEVILEIHQKEQLVKLSDLVTIVGVNNRNLKNLQIEVNSSFKLAALIPSQFLSISESGISSPDTIRKLMDSGYKGFLIGEYFMRHEKPAEACKMLIKKVLKKN